MSEDIETSHEKPNDSLSKRLTIEVGKLMYYQKPVLGVQGNTHSGEASNLPLQLIFPSGNFGLGIPLNMRTDDTHGRISDITAIISIPESNDTDDFYRKGIVAIFLSTFLTNMIITILLYINASEVDISRVEPFNGIQFYFSKIPKTRSYDENVSFGFTIAILVIGAMGALLEQPTILSGFCYAILLNFILGTQTLPYYAYSMRYLLDAFMLYLGLVLRQKCSAAFLPVHLHGT